MSKRKGSFEFMLPKSKTEANKLVQQIGELQVVQQKTEQEMNEKIEKLRNEANRKIKTRVQLIRKRLIGLFVFYWDNRKELTREGKKKIVDLGFGDEIGCFMPSKKSVSFRGKEKVVEALKKLKLSQFYHEVKKVELDREAIAKNEKLLSKIKGIIFKREEKFMVRPGKTKVPITENVKKLKKFLS